MPEVNGKYVAPTWTDGIGPAIDAEELQAICDAIVRNQALCENPAAMWVWKKEYIGTTFSNRFPFATYTFYKTAKVENGSLVLEGAFSLALNASNYKSVVGCYYHSASSGDQLIGAVSSVDSSGVTYKNVVISASFILTNLIEYMASTDPDAYPQGQQDNWYYTLFDRLGSVFEKRMVTGTYYGTGTYGAYNKNSLTFDFEPKLIVIVGPATDSQYEACGAIIIPQSGGYTLKRSDSSSTSSLRLRTSVSNKTVTWYTMAYAADWQANLGGWSYTYVAIG